MQQAWHSFIIFINNHNLLIWKKKKKKELYCETKNNKLLQLLFSVHNLVYSINITSGGVFGSSAAERIS